MPNKRVLSEIMVHNIQRDLICGSEPHTIIGRYPELWMHRRTVYNIIAKFRKTGIAYHGVEVAKMGRLPKLTEEHIDALEEYIAARCDWYLDELRDFLGYEHDVWASESTISRALKRREFSRKVVIRIAAQRDQELCLMYYARVSMYYTDMLVFVDESAANERTTDRKYGWSPRGVPAWVTKELRKSLRWSILPAYTVDGYLDSTLIIRGSVNSDEYARWLEFHLLPQCGRYPGPRSVIIMDNCSTHRNEVIALSTF